MPIARASSLFLLLAVFGPLASASISSANRIALSAPVFGLSASAQGSSGSSSPFLLAGREDDARVAGVAYKLANASIARCPSPVPLLGIVLQHLTQFEQPDRAGMIAALNLDRGPVVIVVVPTGPAAQAGMRAGDVLLAINGHSLPAETGVDAAFSASQAHARADFIDGLLEHAAVEPFSVTVLRDGSLHTLHVDAPRGCPSQVFLARSDQRNAYADGRHVFLTTGLLAKLRNDDELAFLMAHEMAHNILGHAAIMRSGAVKRGIGRTLGRSGEVVRSTERAADRLGTQLMMDAGYDPLKGIDVLRRLDGTDFGIALFQEHDSAGKRMTMIRQLVQAARAH